MKLIQYGCFFSASLRKRTTSNSQERDTDHGHRDSQFGTSANLVVLLLQARKKDLPAVGLRSLSVSQVTHETHTDLSSFPQMFIQSASHVDPKRDKYCNVLHELCFSLVKAITQMCCVLLRSNPRKHCFLWQSGDWVVC